MREIRTSGSTRGRCAADFNPLRVVLLYRPFFFRTYWPQMNADERR